MILNITCPDCKFSKKVPIEKIPEGIKFVKCPRCSNTFELPPITDLDTASQENSDLDFINKFKPDYETVTPEELGYFTELWKTFTGVLFSPDKFFSEKRHEAGIGQSFAFGMLMGSLGVMFGAFWQFLLSSQELSFILKVFPESFTVNHLFLSYIIISPLLVIISMFIITAILHCCLFILGGTTRGFTGTFKVCAYSNASSIFSLIPLLGGFIGAIWGLVVMVIGLREIHETSTLRTVFALLIPVFILIILGIFLLFIAFFITSSQFI